MCDAAAVRAASRNRWNVLSPTALQYAYATRDARRKAALSPEITRYNPAVRLPHLTNGRWDDHRGRLEAVRPSGDLHTGIMAMVDLTIA